MQCVDGLSKHFYQVTVIIAFVYTLYDYSSSSVLDLSLP